MEAGVSREIMLCPASGADAFANVEKTIARPARWTTVISAAAETTVDVMAPAVSASGEIYFWGFRENSRDKRDISPKPPQSWQRLVPGTLLVFIGRDRPTYVATIGGIAYDPGLSTALWVSDEFCWVVGLVDVEERPDVTAAAVQEAAGVRRVQMAMPVQPARRDIVLKLLAAETAAPISITPSPTTVEFDPSSPLSVFAYTERRNEQGWLRRNLIPAPSGACDLCGEMLPSPFLRVAHVKPRSLCTDDERRDLTNILVACVFCDVAFERGWLSLDDRQQVVVSTTQPTTPELRARLAPLAGRTVTRPLNQASVTFHRQRSFAR